MKYYEKMLSMGCFTLQDIVNITGNRETARSVCKTYLKKGYIDRIKRDLYVAVSLRTRQPVVNRFVIAANASENAIISYHSAFEYYGYANQVFYEMDVTSAVRFHDFSYDGFRYRRIMPQIKTGIVHENEICVTTLERTVIDSINKFEKIGGLEELLRCIALIPSLKEEEMLECLSEYNNGYLYQKTGYLLSFFQKSLNLSDNFFQECRNHIPKGKSYLYLPSEDFSFFKDWRIYAPSQIHRFISKGMFDLNAV